MKISEYLKNTFGYSNFQLSQIKYTLSSILSEITKLIILGTFYVYRNKLPEFLVVTIILVVLRSSTGGLHFKHYITCLLFTFLVTLLAIEFLPMINLSKPGELLILTLCIISNYLCGPVVSSYRPIPNGLLVKKSKYQAFIVIFTYLLFLFITPYNQLIEIGFWVIVIQSTQLMIAKLLKRRENNESFNKIVDI